MSTQAHIVYSLDSVLCYILCSDNGGRVYRILHHKSTNMYENLTLVAINPIHRHEHMHCGISIYAPNSFSVLH